MWYLNKTILLVISLLFLLCNITKGDSLSGWCINNGYFHTYSNLNNGKGLMGAGELLLLKNHRNKELLHSNEKSKFQNSDKEAFLLLHIADSIFLHTYEHELPVKLTMQALDIIANNHGKESKEYAIALCTLAHLYAEQSQDTTIIISNEARDILEKYPIDLNYAKLLGNMSYAYTQIGTPEDYKKARNLAENSLDCFRNINLTNSADYANSLVYLSEALIGLNLYSEALCNTNKALNIVQKHKEYDFKCMDVYAYALHVKVMILYANNEMHESLKNCYELVNIRKKVFGAFSRPYAVSLSNLATIEDSEGLLNLALEHYGEVANIEEELYGLYTKNSLQNYSNLLRSYLTIKKLSKARECYEKVCQIADGLLFTGDSINFSIIDYRDAIIEYHIYIGDFNTAYSIAKDSYELAKDKNYLYGERLFSFNISKILKAMEKYTEANEYTKLWYRNYIREFGRQPNVFPLISASYNVNDFERMNQFIHQYFANIKQDIQYRFPLMSNHNRERYIKMESSEIFKELPYYIDKIRTPKLVEYLYNILLLERGLLIRTESDFENIINNSSQCIRTLYEDYCLNTKIIEEESSCQISDRTYDIDSLTIINHQILDTILQHCPQIKESTRHLMIEMNDVRNVLADDEIAIEFIDIIDKQTGTYSANAIVLEKNLASPIIVDLFNEIDLFSTDKYEWYKSNELYFLIWKPLELWLKSKKKVFFSPSCSLAHIAIETVLTPENKRISDFYELIRLSSTKELVLNREHEQIFSFTLFGGLNYNVEVFVDSLRHNIFDNKFNYNKVLDIRQGKTFTYLPQSKVEVEKIVGLITKSLDKCNVSAIVSNQGTESAFNSYCTNGSNILHLATHGFYLKKDSTERKQTQLSFKFKNLGFKSTISKEDDAMERSGLLLSGGNFAIKNRNNYIPHEQDGILTASEIYYKNIPNLELVVLSACDTGLGEVCGEGVYGLQRAFKKAGAKSILMSLWEVDDFATQMLMVEFYKHFLNGETKAKSLLKAQRYIKSQKGFEEPEYWAGFILLDGLN